MKQFLEADITRRAFWTFVQAFLAVLVVTDVATYEVALAAGVGAVLSVIKTYAVHQLDAIKHKSA